MNDVFAAHGTVESARVITDKFTGQSRGFSFVEMSTPEEANAAIAALNGTQMDGRTLTVNEAKHRNPFWWWRRRGPFRWWVVVAGDSGSA